MRSNSVRYKIATVALGMLVLASCSNRTSISQAVVPVQQDPPAVIRTPEPKVFIDGNVAVENVTFTFDLNLIDKVEASALPAEKLESDDIKPDGIGGRTLKFTLNYRRSEDRAIISVFKLDEYKAAFGLFPHYLG